MWQMDLELLDKSKWIKKKDSLERMILKILSISIAGENDCGWEKNNKVF